MQAKSMLLFFALLLILAGCVRSLQPLYTAKDLVAKPQAIGTWIEADGEETWTFRQSGPQSYTMMGSKGAPGDTARFDAHFVQLGKFLFLDLLPQKEGLAMKNDLYSFQLVPVHTFWRIWMEGDTFRQAMLDNDWLKKMLDEGKIEIAHERLDDSIVLTAPTKELQLLVLKYAEDEKAFPKPGEFRRVKGK
ncbi:MAG: hypothetical protein WBD36_05075 [Bacteroidota bacterium]